MLSKKQKKQLVKDLASELKTSPAVVVSDFTGLKVEQLEDLRCQLHEQGIKYQVVKKRLAKVAVKEAGLPGEFLQTMSGSIALAVGGADEVSAAKLLYNFAQKHEQLVLQAGFLGQEFLDQNRIRALAKLPSKDELLAKLVYLLNAPLSGLASVLAGPARHLVNILAQISKNKK